MAGAMAADWTGWYEMPLEEGFHSPKHRPPQPQCAPPAHLERARRAGPRWFANVVANHLEVHPRMLRAGPSRTGHWI